MNELEQRLYNGSQDFTENELSDLVFEYEYDEIEGEEGRWVRSIETIIKVKDKLFCIDWERGLTQYQEDSFDHQPYEVIEQVKTIEVKEYIKK